MFHIMQIFEKHTQYYTHYACVRWDQYQMHWGARSNCPRTLLAVSFLFSWVVVNTYTMLLLQPVRTLLRRIQYFIHFFQQRFNWLTRKLKEGKIDGIMLMFKLWAVAEWLLFLFKFNIIRIVKNAWSIGWNILISHKNCKS